MGRLRVMLSRKGLKGRTRRCKVRSTETKTRTHVDRGHEPQAELEKKLDARTRELTEAQTQLAEAREHLFEALEQQTATSEVLQVISRSPGELEPVFKAMLANATRLCEAKFGILWLAEGDRFRSVALHGVPPALAEARRREPVVPFGPNSGIGRVIRTRRVVHVDDLTKDRAYIERDPRAVSLVERGGARTAVFAP